MTNKILNLFSVSTWELWRRCNVLQEQKDVHFASRPLHLRDLVELELVDADYVLTRCSLHDQSCILEEKWLIYE